MLRIVLDNNIIDEKNIETIKKTNILDLVKSNKIEFYASAKIFEQMIPYLIGLDDARRKKVIDFTFELLNGSRMFTSVEEIVNNELIKKRGKIQFIPYSMQNKIRTSNFYSKHNLEIINNIMKSGSPVSPDVAHSKIKQWAEHNRKMIHDLAGKKFANLDKNIIEILENRGFEQNAINSALNIVKSFDDSGLSTEEKKEIIFENLFNLLLEFDFLANLKKQKKLIKHEQFYIDYYKHYYEPSFAKTMIKIALYGCSYKVVGSQDGKKYDDDWVNDSSYILYTYFADVLLTNDTTYIKNAFDWLYKGKKEILKLDEFINKYCIQKDIE